MKKVSSIAGMVMLLAVAPGCAADCRQEWQSSTPAARFEAGGETVADTQTTLVWMRCAVGQQWNGGSCAGEPQSMDWKEAKQMVERLNREGYAGHNDWRLPVLPELASIVERRCFNPRMNEAVFPGAPSAVFWSAMEKPDATAYAYALDFGGGVARPTLKDDKGAVRLVRGGPWWEPPKMAAK